MNRILLFVILFLYSCSGPKIQGPDPIINVVGEIFQDEKLDDPEFQLCGNQELIVQYYAFGEKTYEGEKIAIDNYFIENYIPPENNHENGLIRIRFVVNCNGETGRFRLMAMDESYEEYKFDTSITNQLVELTKSLDRWKVMKAGLLARDYYQYLIFKIRDGQIIEILP